MTQESRLVIVIDSKNAERNTRAVAEELGNLTTQGVRADSQMTKMSYSIKSLVGMMGGLLVVNKAIAMADGYTQMAARIRNATISTEEYDLVQNRVLATANTTFRSLSEAQEVYLSLAGGMKSLGKNTTETLNLVDSLSFSFTHNATRSDQAQSAMASLSKSMAKGRVDADAWISIVTGADNVIADMAKTTGKSEAEIRKLGASGKVSLEELIKTLIVTREQNEQLANNMENSLQDGFQALENAVTEYVGKINQATSATGLMASGLGLLADNLESIANIAMLGGVAFLTKAIIAQTVATQGAITTSIQRRASLQAEMLAQSQTLALEVQRTRQVTALALTEVNLARQELNSATTRQARAAATMNLTQAEVALAIAQKQTTAATAAQTVAENALNASRSRGAMLLGLVGGPIGAITIGVTALAAGYMYLSNRTAEANAKLEEQGKVANIATEELLKLEGAKKGQAKIDLAESLDAENQKLQSLNTEIGNYIAKLSSKNTADAETAEILQKVRTGTMTYDDAVKKLNKSHANQPDIIKKMEEAIVKYKQSAVVAQNNADKQKAMGVEVKLAGNAAQNATPQIRNKTNATREDAAASRDAAQANREYAHSINNNIASNAFAVSLKQSKAFADSEIDILTQIYNEKRRNGEQNIVISAEDIRLAKEGAKWQAAKSKAFEDTSKASKSFFSQQKKDMKEAEQNTIQSIEDAKSLIYDYTSEFIRIETDLNNEIARINEAALKSNSKNRMIADATEISEARKRLYTAELDFELNQYKMSEAEKFKSLINIDKLRIDSTRGFLADERTLKKKILDELQAHELALIKLAKEERIFRAEQAMYTEMDLIKKRYDFEMQEAEKVRDSEERARRINAASFNKKSAENSVLINTTLNYKSAIGEDVSADRELIDRQVDIDRMYENGFIKQQEYENQSLESMRQYERDKQDLSLNSMSMLISATSSTWSSMTSLIKDSVGEQSGIYKGMFIAQQAFAMTSATINALLAYNQVLANPWTFDPISKQTAASITLGMGMVNVGMIGAQTIAGFATGGKIRGAGTPTSDSIPIMASDEEYMVRAYAAEKLGTPTLDYINKYGELPQNTHRVGVGAVNAISSGGGAIGTSVVQPKVTIHNYSSEKVETSTNSDGELMVTIGKMLDQKIVSGVDQGIQRNLRQGYPLANAIKGR